MRSWASLFHSSPFANGSGFLQKVCGQIAMYNTDEAFLFQLCLGRPRL